MNKNIIQEICYHQEGDQSWYYYYIVNEEGHKLRVSIRRNAYDHQSYARVERWDGSEWQYVCHNPINNCFCKTIEYTDGGITVDRFHRDRDVLIDVALKIVR